MENKNTQTNVETNSGGTGEIWFWLIAILLFIGIATNPNKEKHKDAIVNKAVEYAQQQSDGSVGEALGIQLGANIVDGVLEQRLNITNLGFMSIGSINDKDLTVGILGNVFVIRSFENNNSNNSFR